MHTKKSVLALALFATTGLAATAPAHAQTPVASARLSPQATRAFQRIMPTIKTCLADVRPVMTDLSLARNNLQLGNADTGYLQQDAQQLRADCYRAMSSAGALRFGPAQSVARRVRGELSAAARHNAQAGDDLDFFVRNVNAGIYEQAQNDMSDAAGDFGAGADNLRIVRLYLSVSR